jgi:hypothetical protein
MAALVTPLDPRAKSTGPVPWINTVWHKKILELQESLLSLLIIWNLSSK